MRIAFAYDSAYPWVKGGIERRMFLIMQEMVGEGHEVHMFSMFREGMKSYEFKQNGIHYHCVGSALPTKEMYKNGRRNIGWAIKYALLLALRIWEYRFDVIDADAFPFLHIPMLGIYAFLTGTKFIVTWDEAWDLDYWLKYLSFGGIAGFLMEKLSAISTDRMIANMSDTKEEMVKNLDVNPENVEVLPAAISAKEMRDFRSKHRATKREGFVVVARLVHYKRVDLAIRAVAGTGERLTVIGSGPERDRLMALAKRLGISKRVVFTQGLSEYEYKRALSYAKALLMFSKKEGMSITTIEALALGTPVIITEDTSLPRQIRRYCITMELGKGALNNFAKRGYLSTGLTKAVSDKVIGEFSVEQAGRVYDRLCKR
ncbi:MAG: glycosyltransferase [Candidatus Micrarchaeota archaeon]|nr:glycosyltransferase [Candidatus Micrarchaeota archaeon]MDE1847550.1 glycosyltransferase [Candidatus Micrarchaeota archaeon]MDE1864267.1 glycosyltransferase [Candidatus Micrarchaeota archaeon]